MKKFWNLIIKALDCLADLLGKVGKDKLYHVIAGMIIAAFFGITLRMSVCIVPVVFAALIKEGIDDARPDGSFDWWDILATLLGGLIIQLFVIL